MVHFLLGNGIVCCLLYEELDGSCCAFVLLGLDEMPIRPPWIILETLSSMFYVRACLVG